MFERIISLIGQANFDKLRSINVLIVGLGGVGGYALETLVRSGISNISLIDYDIIDESNLNRQIITNESNIGKCKVEEAKNRALSINPNINIRTYNTFLDISNIDKILENNYDYIIDACDSVETKMELIKKSMNSNFKLISSMGTAKKLDLTKLSITTLDKTNYDPLAKVIRKKCKESNINLKKVRVVSTTEKALSCKNLGSMMMVPATSGILCAYYVINDIISFDK